ncbi:MAG TPA: carbamoyltransferase HypF [Spirochaetia bacterium]|nr:carbamoyltransferase HypF [Spirochaetia bacterium]
MRTVSRQILIEGVVQGVGFRPFVYKEAHALGLTGYVTNTAQGVRILVQGSEKRIEKFARTIRSSAPPQSVLESMSVQPADGNEGPFARFQIRESVPGGERVVRISRDLAVCDDCLAELTDPRNRRYLYPFINCTNCGPRFTIVTDIPYDRAVTTMRDFPMCADCLREYEDPGNRRFHAQPNACHTCGPKMSLKANNGTIIREGGDKEAMEDILARTASLLAGGAIIGVKGLGGYRVACHAGLESAVGLLRLRKRREEKPLAVMVRDQAAAGRIVRLQKYDAARLAQVDTPIMLLPKREHHGLAAGVAPDSDTFGVMLPGTPFEHLVMRRIGFPLIMTSANFSDEPIVYRDGEALGYLQPICDFFLTGERPIHTRTDDSVLRRFRGSDYPIRRSRGAVPIPVTLPETLSAPVLAVGAELKNTICLAEGRSAYVSQHIGDLKNRETFTAFTESIAHFMTLCAVRPRIIAHDLHPQYLSTQFALDPPPSHEWVVEALKLPVQHHHAHIVSCLADNEAKGPVIGIALDGTGWGEDETVWGGEVLVADARSFTRRACFSRVVMPGGDLAIKEPWRMALAYCEAVFGKNWSEAITKPLCELPEQKLAVTMAQLSSSTSLPRTSSCGRLFDALAAMTGVCMEARYEGQPAIMFEQAGRGIRAAPYPFPVERKGDLLTIEWDELFRMTVHDMRAGVPAGIISARFHEGLADVLAAITVKLCRETGIRQAALSGGCFMNMTLLSALVSKLEAEGVTPLVHRRVPCNDGGIALGQAVAAAARLRD